MFSLPASGRGIGRACWWICCAQKEYVRGCSPGHSIGRSRRKILSVLPGKLTDCMPRSLTWGRWHRNLKKYTSGREVRRICKYNGSRYIRKRDHCAHKRERSVMADKDTEQYLRKENMPHIWCPGCGNVSLCTMLFVRHSARPEQGQGMYGHRLLVKSRRIYELQHGAHHSRPRDPSLRPV